MKRKYIELVAAIRDAIRRKAQDIPKFREQRNGAIRILAYPCNQKADYWLGGLGYFDGGFIDIPDYEHTFAIAPGGSRVIKGIWDGEEQSVDCYAYSALKIAHCSRAQDLKKGLISGLDLGDPHLTEDNGYAAHRGAICVEVKQVVSESLGYHSSTTYEKEFCGIYVSVSGADSKDDELCAREAIDVIRKYFENEKQKFVCRFPSFSENEGLS